MSTALERLERAAEFRYGKGAAISVIRVANGSERIETPNEVASSGTEVARVRGMTAAAVCASIVRGWGRTFAPETPSGGVDR